VRSASASRRDFRHRFLWDIAKQGGGFKALRTRWLNHLGSTTRRSVLLIDEAQEMSPMVLNELRLISSARFDSQSLLCAVLAGATPGYWRNSGAKS
jgi:hypothetical protein